MASKKSKKQNSPDIDGDADFLGSIDNVDALKDTPTDADIDTDEDFDFDGHDAQLKETSSWIGEGIRSTDDRDEFSSAISDDLDEEFVPGQSEVFSDENVTPDSSDIFGAGSPDSLGEIAALEEQRDAYLEALRQLQADFENYKKRIVRDQLDDADAKSAKLIEDLLPVIDNFQLAMGVIEESDSGTKKLIKGLELVHSELFQVLEKQGLEIIEANGALFDPEIHDAVTHEDNNEHEQEVVVEVLRPGYKVRGRVIRPAMVKVAK